MRRERRGGTEGSDGFDLELAVAHLLVVENDEGEDFDGCMESSERKNTLDGSGDEGHRALQFDRSDLLLQLGVLRRKRHVQI